MYTIGQFSKIGRVSAKTLRFYDEIGLIKPSHVDRWNSYRYYSAEQVLDILLINELKGYGFQLEEIKMLMGLKDREALREAMGRKLKDLTEQLEHITKASQRIEEKIKYLEKGGTFMGAVNNYNIEIKEKPAALVFGVRKSISFNEFDRLIGELCNKFEREAVKACGPVMAVYYGEEFNPEDMDVEVCIPVVESTVKKVKGVRKLPGGKHACTIYTGPYSRIGAAYAEIMKWINQNGCSIAGPSFEIYLVSPADTKDEERFVTEICFPIGE